MTPTRAAVTTVSVVALVAVAVLLITADTTGEAKVLLIVVGALLVAVLAAILPTELRKRFAPFVAVFVAAVGLISTLAPENGGTSDGQRPTSPSGPTGNLTLDSVGPVRQGMTMAQVEEQFGSPSQKTQQGPVAAIPALKTWEWNLPNGEIFISFRASNGRMIHYGTTSPRLPTSQGPRVGDSFSSLKDVWGTALEPVTLGSDTSNSTNGLWTVTDPSTKNSLLFRISDGTISTIWGGSSLIAE